MEYSDAMQAVALPVIALETARLLLRPLEIMDADAVQELFPQWEIVKFMTDRVPWPYPADGSLTFIRDVALAGMRQGTEWHWSIRRKAEPAKLIGIISLSEKTDDNRGFWLDPAWQGQGLMSEAVVVVTDYWFEVLGRLVLRSPKAVANIRSRRISERTKMRLIKTVELELVSGRLPGEIWEITREEWRIRPR